MSSGIEKMIDTHDIDIRELNSNLHKISVDLNVLITNHKFLQDNVSKLITNNEILFEKMDKIESDRRLKVTIWNHVKENSKTILAVALPSVGVIGTILYEVGKYLRHLPVP